MLRQRRAVSRYYKSGRCMNTHRLIFEKVIHYFLESQQSLGYQTSRLSAGSKEFGVSAQHCKCVSASSRPRFSKYFIYATVVPTIPMKSETLQALVLVVNVFEHLAYVLRRPLLVILMC